jgi:hypothetical protein
MYPGSIVGYFTCLLELDLIFFPVYLHQDNPAHPLINNVDVALYRLGKATGSENSTPEMGALDEEYMVPTEEIPFIEQEATVDHQEDASYGLVLRNYTPHALYPYILFFDPASYQITHY